MNRLTSLIIIIVALTNVYTDSNAQFLWFGRKKATQDTTTVAPKAKKAPREGFFSVRKEKEDWFFEIPDSLLNVPFLTVTRYVSTPVELGTYGGELVNHQMNYWQKKDNKLYLRTLVYDATAPIGDDINRALAVSTEDPIVASFKIESKEKSPIDSTLRYSIKVTQFLLGDNIVTGFTERERDEVGATGIKSDLSYIDRIDTYPINTEVSTVKTYNCKKATKAVGGKITGIITFRFNTSFVQLPRDPMRRRIFDARVGYFTESDRLYSDDQQQVRRRHFAARWRLEPKNAADIEKMKRGELIEPKKPIVYYIDPATPKKWRKYLIQGVNDWNAAFEAAGWKNAIHAEEWPEDSTGISMEDARFSVIRYLASPIKNAYGPHISDPRTGEILNSDIGWYHNVMELIHDWYLVQVGAIDTAARHMVFPDELMGELIRFVSSHEVGHTLGLRHNMGSSSTTPIDSLRCKEWVEKNGHTASIMDYARFNYVAQPEDNIGYAGLMPRINTYDKWAIEWGYKYFPDAQNEEQERLILNKITTERLNNSRRLWFGGEGRDNDPNAQTEDLSNDPTKAAEYGIRNLKRIAPLLPEWTAQEADQYENLRQVFTSLVGQYKRYIGHAASNIGGLYHEYKSVEQSGDVYTPVEKARAKQALEFIDKYAFTEPTWLTQLPYIMKIDRSQLGLTQPLGEFAASRVFSEKVLNNICKYADHKNTYKPIDYANDIVKITFRELYSHAKISKWRKAVQNKAIEVLLNSWGTSFDSESHPYVTMMLDEIEKRASQYAGGDTETKLFYNDMSKRIKHERENANAGLSVTIKK
ncbi:MAG: zinc-dependent metalloprotease [Marinilabiliaceae bacterium]|nr:zinc-dependent metalloprotease [Marinilabiliaceae bacterium]